MDGPARVVAGGAPWCGTALAGAEQRHYAHPAAVMISNYMPFGRGPLVLAAVVRCSRSVLDRRVSDFDGGRRATTRQQASPEVVPSTGTGTPPSQVRAVRLD